MRLIDADVVAERVDGAGKVFDEWVAGAEDTRLVPAIRRLFESIKSFVDNVPTIDAVPVVHGRWDKVPNRYMSVASKNGSYSGNATSCSVCLELNPNAYKTNYCPNCGAKMDLEVDGDG